MKPAGFPPSKLRWAAMLVLAAVLTACASPSAVAETDGAVSVAGRRLPKGRDAYFIENDLAYSRFLALRHDGAYEQINKDRMSCREADRGTWEQAADLTVRLHSTRHALQFRALLSGPLSVVLDDQQKLDAAARLVDTIRRFLASTADAVFDAHTADELNAPPAAVTVEARAETFSRADLQSLVRQMDEHLATERAGTYVFTPWKMIETPLLLILRGAAFQADIIARVKREYRVPANAIPPFYFAQVDARTFAREVGTWEAFQYLGGTK